MEKARHGTLAHIQASCVCVCVCEVVHASARLLGTHVRAYVAVCACVCVCVCVRRCFAPHSDLCDGDRWRKNHCNRDARVRSKSCSMSGWPCPPFPPSSMLECTGSRTMRCRMHVLGPPIQTESSIATLCHVRPAALMSTLNLRGSGSVPRCLPRLDLGEGVSCIVAMNIPSTDSRKCRCVLCDTCSDGALPEARGVILFHVLSLCVAHNSPLYAASSGLSL